MSEYRHYSVGVELSRCTTGASMSAPSYVYSSHKLSGKERGCAGQSWRRHRYVGVPCSVLGVLGLGSLASWAGLLILLCCCCALFMNVPIVVQ